MYSGEVAVEKRIGLFEKTNSPFWKKRKAFLGKHTGLFLKGIDTFL